MTADEFKAPTIVCKSHPRDVRVVAIACCAIGIFFLGMGVLIFDAVGVHAFSIVSSIVGLSGITAGVWTARHGKDGRVVLTADTLSITTSRKHIDIPLGAIELIQMGDGYIFLETPAGSATIEQLALGSEARLRRFMHELESRRNRMRANPETSVTDPQSHSP